MKNISHIVKKIVSTLKIGMLSILVLQQEKIIQCINMFIQMNLERKCQLVILGLKILNMEKCGFVMIKHTNQKRFLNLKQFQMVGDVEDFANNFLLES